MQDNLRIASPLASGSQPGDGRSRQLRIDSFTSTMDRMLSESLQATIRAALRDFEVTGFKEANALRRALDR